MLSVKPCIDNHHTVYHKGRIILRSIYGSLAQESEIFIFNFDRVANYM